jgi:hypothetical protein
VAFEDLIQQLRERTARVLAMGGADKLAKRKAEGHLNLKPQNPLEDRNLAGVIRVVLDDAVQHHGNAHAGAEPRVAGRTDDGIPARCRQRHDRLAQLAMRAIEFGKRLLQSTC